MLTHLLAALPEQINEYYEPFLGGGSLFFLLQPNSAVLSDSCADLVATYMAVRDAPRSVLRYLAAMRPDRNTFYTIRRNRSRGRLKSAAEFIYLNKTCWNGLYRVNSRGEFNVPYGRPKTDYLISEDNLHACADALRKPGVALKACDFEDAVTGATEGDFVFLDPPYVTGHRNNGFVDYNHVLFSWEDQRRLAALAKRLRKSGATVLVTNADHHSIVTLYDEFEKIRFDRKSTIAANSAMRTRTTELVLIGNPE